MGLLDRTTGYTCNVYGWLPTLHISTTDIIKETIMLTQTAPPLPHTLTDQPTGWPLFYLLPQTRYVRRQRAANSPQYHPWKKPVRADYRATSKKQTYYRRCIKGITTARRRLWRTLKRLGRDVVHKLVMWCLLPLAIAACFWMLDAAPAELPADYYAVKDTSLLER